MSGRIFPTPTKALVYIPYVLAALVILFIFGRYVLRLGDPPGLPAQGAEIASLRGGGIFILDRPLNSTTRELIMVSTVGSGRISHWLMVNGVEERTSGVSIQPALLESVKQFQQTWCQQTSLPPTPPPTIETYRLNLTCTTWTGRVFYFSANELPAVLKDVLQEAPALAPS